MKCETDFVARNNDEFRQLCRDIAVHVLGANPKYKTREEMPSEDLDRQKALFVEEAANKPEAVREKLVEGRLARWCGENGVFLDQPFVKDDAKTVRSLLHEVNARTGENITIGRYARFVIGDDQSPITQESI